MGQKFQPPIDLSPVSEKKTRWVMGLSMLSLLPMMYHCIIIHFFPLNLCHTIIINHSIGVPLWSHHFFPWIFAAADLFHGFSHHFSHIFPILAMDFFPFFSWPKIPGGYEAAAGAGLEQLLRWDGIFQQEMVGGLRWKIYGNVSKPCTPGEHQNSW